MLEFAELFLRCDTTVKPSSALADADSDPAEHHPLESVQLPDVRQRPSALPTVAWNPWVDLRERDDIAALNLSFPFQPIPGKRPQYHSYSTNALSEALRAINYDKLSVREASRRFGVPRTSIQDRLSGKVSLQDGDHKMGPDPVLSKEEELKLVTWLEDLAKSGFPRKPDDLLNSVQEIVKATKKETPFVDGCPGKKWYCSFIRRHLQLVTKTPESLTKGRARITEELIRKWFRELEDYLDKIGEKEILSDPDRILNGDETSFSMCPKTG
uniref:HTH psq-type domain-containing protein n=1 Tax=Timema shepardi TaxID=629360 RepID=A0A7R9G6D3_TIMSH|nr:unnamed protein product [Timema shepardi]